MAEWTPELVKLEIYTPCAALEGLLEALSLIHICRAPCWSGWTRRTM